MLIEKYIEELKNTKDINDLKYLGDIKDINSLINRSELLFKNLKKIGFNDKYINEYDNKKIENILLELKPKNTKVLAAYHSIFSKFMKWCVENNYINENDYYDFTNIDKRKSYNKIKDKDIPFISNQEYEQILNDIWINDDNNLYLTTLYMCLYEGIYSKNLYELKYLRIKDIDRFSNEIKLRHEDGTVSYLKVSNKLIDRLIQLGNINEWHRKNKNGDFEIKTTGIYDDSVFKIEMRKYQDENSDTFRHCYYRRIRYINDEYLGRKISPYNIFISGIVHRVNIMAKKEGAEFNKYFNYKEDNFDKITVIKILEKELERVNLTLYESTGEFMRLIKDYINMF